MFPDPILNPCLSRFLATDLHVEDAEGKPSGTCSAFLKQHLRSGTQTTLFLFTVSTKSLPFMFISFQKRIVIEDELEKLSRDDKTSKSNYWKFSSVVIFFIVSAIYIYLEMMFTGLRRGNQFCSIFEN